MHKPSVGKEITSSFVCVRRFYLFFSILQVGSNLANAVDDGQWSQGLISAVSYFDMLLYKLCFTK